MGWRGDIGGGRGGRRIGVEVEREERGWGRKGKGRAGWHVWAQARHGWHGHYIIIIFIAYHGSHTLTLPVFCFSFLSFTGHTRPRIVTVITVILVPSLLAGCFHCSILLVIFLHSCLSCFCYLLKRVVFVI